MADMAVQRDAMEAAGPYDRARAINAFKLGDVTFYWVTRACAISVLLILGGIILSAKSVRGRYRDYCQVEFYWFVSRWHEGVLEVRPRRQARAPPRAPSGSGA